MNLDLDKLIELKNQTSQMNVDIIEKLSTINTNLDNICSNVQSTNLTNSTNNLTNIINSVSTKLGQVLPNVTNFLDSQIAQYSTANEAAKTDVDRLVQIMGGISTEGR